MKIYFLIIIISAFLDIVANLMLKKSNGFKNKKFGFLAILFAIMAFFLLLYVFEHLPLSIAYSTWGAIGILGTTLGAWIFYKERLNLLGILGVLVVILAVVLLNYEKI